MSLDQSDIGHYMLYEYEESSSTTEAKKAFDLSMEIKL